MIFSVVKTLLTSGIFLSIQKFKKNKEKQGEKRGWKFATFYPRYLQINFISDETPILISKI